MHFFFKDARCPIRLKFLYGLETVEFSSVLFLKFINISDQRIIKNLLIEEIRMSKSIAEHGTVVKTDTNNQASSLGGTSDSILLKNT